MPVLQVSDLRKSYGTLCAVDGIGFSIDAGEIFGLLGPNGAGKTTTINIIATLLSPDHGDVMIRDTPWSSSPRYKRRLGYVPQEVSLAERLTARENLTLVGRLYDLRRDLLEGRVAETLDAVGLSERADDMVGTFSGGMKRRLNIACALLHEPDLLLMDEPTVGVDPQARAYIFEIVERLAERGRAVLYTTHYMEEAQRLCRRTAIIDHGKVLAMGTPSELTRNAKAEHALVIEADGLTAEVVARLARRMGDIPWRLEDCAAYFNVTGAGCSLLDAVRAADEAGIRPKSISIREPTLEAVFLELTGHALRD